MIHLTNDAVQKKGEENGKFENANKVKKKKKSILDIIELKLSFFFSSPTRSFKDI
jgi:hypothetical protein